MAAAALVVAAAAAAGWWWWAVRVPSRYFTAAELERVAQPMHLIDIDPQGREGVDYYGTLRLDVFINEKGGVDLVEVVEASVPPGYRDRAAQAFAAARFEAATRRGRAVKSLKKVEVRFSPPIRGLDRSEPGR